MGRMRHGRGDQSSASPAPPGSDAPHREESEREARGASSARPPDEEDARKALEASDSGLRSLIEQLVQPPPLTPTPGEWIGGPDGRRFQILAQLGSGTMGRVLLAFDHALQRKVALKFLLAGAEATNLRLAELMRREAQAIAHLDHENIVRIFDVADWHSPLSPSTRVPFLVMEHLEGEPLDALLRRGPMEPWRALDIVIAVATGLAHAHGRNIVHRDLKPSNVFILPDGKVKLLDFGLAHAAGTALVPELTDAGTPAYMAPEQWRGETPDARADLWAAGVMLYQLLGGVLPFAQVSLEELRAHVLSPDPMPSLRERRPDLPVELVRLVAAALAKKRERRLGSAAELAERLREIRPRVAGEERPPAPAVLQQRQVTILSCRLVRGPAPLDPEELGEVQATFQRECLDRVRGYGCSVVSAVGDEVLACFGYPRAHEEDTADAARAALALAREVPGTLSPVLSGASVRVGLHTGTVVLSGGSAHTAPTIQGEAPQVASGLSRQADVGCVLVSPATRLLVRGAFHTRPFVPSVLDSSPRPEAYRLIRAKRLRSRFERAAHVGALTPLVDRERELTQLLALWGDTLRGRGACVVLRGEAGIGKSRLVQEVGTRILCAADGAWVRGQCWEQMSNSAFFPVIDLIQRRLEFRPGQSREEKLRRLFERLGNGGTPPEHLAVLASLLSLPAARDSALRLSPERQREQTLDALVGLLLRAAASQPHLLVMEDLHWADPSTLQLLDLLIDKLADARILLLVTTRPDFDPAFRPRPWLHDMPLERLPPERTRSLIRHVMAGRALPSATLEQLVAKTDGVPLFAEEMTRMVVEHAAGGAAPEMLPSSIPITLQGLLLARLDQLPPRQKALAQLAAVVGRRIPEALLAAFSARALPELSLDLAELAEAGLLEQAADAPEPTWVFRHALIQDAAYQSLPRSERRRYHGRLARVLAEQFPGLGEEHPEVLAHHHSEAGEEEAAIRHWTQAGLGASRRFAHVEALSHLNQALKLIQKLPEGTARAERELPVLIALGQQRFLRGGLEAPGLAEMSRRTLALMKQVGDALPRLDLTYWGPFAYYFGRAQLDTAQAMAEYQTRLGERLDDSELRAQGHRHLAIALNSRGEFKSALEQAQRAVAESAGWSLEQHRRLALKQWVEPACGALGLEALLSAILGQPVKARARADEALALMDRIGHPPTVVYGRLFVARALRLHEDAVGVLACAEKALALAREHRIRMWMHWTLVLLAWARAALGAPEEGLALVEQSLASQKISGIMSDRTHALATLAEIRLMLGRDAEGIAAADEGLAIAEQGPERDAQAELYRLRAELLWKGGEHARAEADFLRAIATSRSQAARTYEQRATFALCRRLLQQGRRDEARARLAALEVPPAADAHPAH